MSDPASCTFYLFFLKSPSFLDFQRRMQDESKRRVYRDVMKSEGGGYVGLHSLLTVPRGELHITTPSDGLRQHSWEYLRRLVDLCADLGDNGRMILGSGRQRRAVEGSSVEDATKRLRDGLAEVTTQAKNEAWSCFPRSSLHTLPMS